MNIHAIASILKDYNMEHQTSKKDTVFGNQTWGPCCTQQSMQSQYAEKNVKNKRSDEFFEFFLYMMTNSFLAIFAHDPNCIRLILLVIPNAYGKKNQQRFKKFQLRILIFIRCMSHNSLKPEPHYLLMNFLWPILFIIKEIKYNYLRRQVKTSFHIDFILRLVHISIPIVHQFRMVNILNIILYVLSEEIWFIFLE